MPQHSVNQYRLDLALISDETRIDIEVDGESTHLNPRFDVERDIRLTELGWRVVRFWNHQIRDDIDYCVSTVLSLLSPTQASYPDSSHNVAGTISDGLQDDAPETIRTLGTLGNVLQATAGFNLTAAPNKDLRDSVARAMGFQNSYYDLEPYQKGIVRNRIRYANGDELRLAAETGARRGQEWAKYQKAVNDVDGAYEKQMKDLMMVILPKTPRNEYWRVVDKYYEIESERRIGRQKAAEIVGVEFDDREPQNELEQAFQGCQDLLEASTTEGGVFDSAAFSESRDAYMATLTPEQRAYVARNRNLMWLPPLSPMQRVLLSFLRVYAKKEAADIGGSMDARSQHIHADGPAQLLDKGSR